MSTLKIWDLHMTCDGPVTDAFLAETRRLAGSIATEPGIIWKIWPAHEGSAHYGSTQSVPKPQRSANRHGDAPDTPGSGRDHRGSDHIFDIVEDVGTLNNASPGRQAA